MTPRFICPHCHRSIDPQSMETACNAGDQYRVCPECDEPVVLAMAGRAVDAATRVNARSSARVAEDCAR